MIRKAVMDDLPNILKVYEYAREFMRDTKNPAQWGNSYPPKDLLTDDIRNGQLYVMENNGIHAVFALIFGEDPTYRKIYNGQWISDTLYATIHRIAGDGSVRGVLKTAVDFAESKINHLRIDTHKDNQILQHLILKNGFSRCGIIYLEDGSPRIAYEKIL